MNFDKNDKNSEVGNTKPLRNRSTKYSVTWNNYTTEDYEKLLLTIKTMDVKYVIGKEIGEAAGRARGVDE